MTAAVTRHCDNQVRVGRKYQKCGKVVESGEPTLFSLDGTAYSADLCDACKLLMQQTMAPFVKISRPEYVLVEGVVRKALAKLPNGQAVSATDVRLWAKKNKIPVSDTGRIGNDVYQRYYEAHGIGISGSDVRKWAQENGK